MFEMAESAEKPDVKKLAEKLDKDIDDFIDTLPKSKYKDGFSEDNWEEVRICYIMHGMMVKLNVQSHPFILLLASLDMAVPGLFVFSSSFWHSVKSFYSAYRCGLLFHYVIVYF